jgi:apolipoprotein N-acyltransferase
VAEGAEVLVNITNDAWFGDSAAPHQHLLMARMRAVENRRYLLRAANSGISAVIDPLGRLLSTTGLHRRTVLDGDFRFRQTTTFYSRNGDLFAWLCLAMSLIPGITAIGWRRLKRSRRSESGEKQAGSPPLPPA